MGRLGRKTVKTKHKGRQKSKGGSGQERESQGIALEIPSPEAVSLTELASKRCLPFSQLVVVFTISSVSGGVYRFLS